MEVTIGSRIKHAWNELLKTPKKKGLIILRMLNQKEKKLVQS